MFIPTLQAPAWSIHTRRDPEEVVDGVTSLQDSGSTKKRQSRQIRDTCTSTF